MNDLSKLDEIKISKVIFLIGNSNHHNLNKSTVEKSLNYNLTPLKKALDYFSNRRLKKFISFSGALVYDEHKLKHPCKEHSPLNHLKNTKDIYDSSDEETEDTDDAHVVSLASYAKLFEELRQEWKLPPEDLIKKSPFTPTQTPAHEKLENGNYKVIMTTKTTFKYNERTVLM